MVSEEVLSADVRRRMRWLHRGVATVLLGLLVYLFSMQVLEQETFAKAAEMNSVRRVRVDAPRGFIADRDGRVLAKNRPSFDLVVVKDKVVSVDATVQKVAAMLGWDAPGAKAAAARLRSSGRPEVILAEDLRLAAVATIEARTHEWPEFRIHRGLVRHYPHGRSLAHALGHMGEIRQRQLDDSQFAGYRSGDVIGQTGLEASYEPRLRGRDGSRWVQVNSHGREIKALDGIEPPQPGKNLRLTIDLDVQRAAEEAFGDYRGAAVAIDANSGDVLALVSRPGFDPNAFAGKISGDLWKGYQSDPTHPLFDRALRATLPPGSVFKIVNAIAGLEEHSWDPDARINCNGRTVIHRDSFACWRPGGHGSVDLHMAMRGSCNVFFYHRGDATGIQGMADWSKRLGLGVATGIDIGPEAPGLVPDPEWKRRVHRQPWWPGETVSVAIGQGAVQVSVLQVARLLQIIATGGTAWVPRLVAEIDGVQQPPSPVAFEVALRPDTLLRLRKALWAVVNENGGTARRTRLPGYGVSGKTGTAQAPPGPLPQDRGEHAWFAGYGPGTQPEVIAAVYVERGGHGGETAAPVARAIFETVIRKRGIAPTEPVEPLVSAVPTRGPAPLVPVVAGAAVLTQSTGPGED